MADEMIALQKNSTRGIVELPVGKKTVWCKLVFTVKYKLDGTVKYTRLGWSQKAISKPMVLIIRRLLQQLSR